MFSGSARSDSRKMNTGWGYDCGYCDTIWVTSLGRDVVTNPRKHIYTRKSTYKE